MEKVIKDVLKEKDREPFLKSLQTCSVCEDESPSPGTSGEISKHDIWFTPETSPTPQDDSGEENDYTKEGAPKSAFQDGTFQEQVKSSLVHHPDFEFLEVKECYFNLRFLANHEDRIRAKNLIINVIKAFSTIPGKLIVQEGVKMLDIKVKFINQYEVNFHSSEGTHSVTTVPDDLDKPGTKTYEIIEDFKKGVILKSKLKSLPNKKISIETKGFNLEAIKIMSDRNPELDTRKLIRKIYAQMGELRRVSMLYHI
ncbi:unnamed protein product [Colias eurytheme]|nr:unnamed protein product [Colias eurytheme]